MALGMALTDCCGVFSQWPLWGLSTTKLFILRHSCSFNQKFICMDLWHDTVFLNTQKIWSTTCLIFLISWWDVKSHTRSQTHDVWLNWLLWFCFNKVENRTMKRLSGLFFPKFFDFKTQGCRQKGAKTPLRSYYFFFP